MLPKGYPDLRKELDHKHMHHSAMSVLYPETSLPNMLRDPVQPNHCTLDRIKHSGDGKTMHLRNPMLALQLTVLNTCFQAFKIILNTDLWAYCPYTITVSPNKEAKVTTPQVHANHYEI